MFRSLLFTIFLSIACFNVNAQMDHRLTPGEIQQLPLYGLTRGSSAATTSSILPPASNVRTIGEWEEIQGLVVAWVSYPSMLREIIRNARLECKVYVVCSNAQTVINDLQNNNIDTSNVVFVVTPFNSVWSRDYGPWSVYTNDVDSLLTIDWIYNRVRPNDDAVSVAIANAINSPLYQTTSAPWNLVNTGGNFMTDGFGTAFSSNLILTDNLPSAGYGGTQNASGIDTIVKHFMGINRYIRFPTLPYDAIHHIDMHLKLLNEETLLVGQYPQGVADGPQIEANLQYILANYNSVYGTPYKVIRMPMPDDNGIYPNTSGRYFTYTNSSFINKTLIFPTYNIPADTTALRIYKDALPGYNVVGINSLVSIGALGALHCITKELGTADPLLISHQQLPNTTDTINNYAVIARIQHRSGIANATLYFRTDTLQPWQSVPMNSLSSQINYWGGSIPAQQIGTRVYYYIEAQSNSGKHQVRPIPAPSGYWYFDITGVTGIATSEISTNQLGTAFPNPSKGITCIPISLAQNSSVTAGFYDETGRLLIPIQNGNLSKGEHKLFMNTESIASGIYLIKVNIGTQSYIQKIAVRF